MRHGFVHIHDTRDHPTGVRPTRVRNDNGDAVARRDV